jgi:deoxyxylulose-5-phosphate synthase
MRTMGIPDRFVAHGGRAELLREIELDAQGIGEWVRDMVSTSEAPPRLRAVGGHARETA